MDDDRSPFRELLRQAQDLLPRGGRAAVGAAAFALVIGLTLIRTGTDAPPRPPQPDPAAARSAATPPGEPSPDHRTGDGARRLPPVRAPIAASPPRRVVIPAAGVDAPVTPVGLGPEGLLEVPPPQAENLAGWYEGAATPGERGTAVVVGHVDNASGPAVFFRLGAVQRGSEVRVARKDGRTAVFTVYAVELHRKEAFPGDRVYRDTGRAELRVITCGGGYAEETGYQGNVVAYARLTGVR
ncbi:class F sortase [Streptomyces sp. DSM 42041]|uniref:Class F sortase n=1 Tax=Streptomyces hazeniae TaxID=3075538 RepID=A0ABU2NW43_9ACTN|nr:class F sortase [Streptomyces sp. DSM 42041]MDT0381204.1 class F sortase [Streptomyces sp. DSM 42041]